MTQQEQACSQKVGAIETTCKILVSSLLGGGFMNAREKDFTPVATKVLTLKESMCQTALGSFVVRLSDLHSALAAAKSLVRPLQAFVTSGKRSIGDKMHNDFVVTVTFGQKHHMKVCAEVSCAFLKTSFMDVHTRSVDEAINLFENYPFEPSVARLPPESPLSIPSLAHFCLCSVILDSLRAPLASSGEDGDPWVRQKMQLLDCAKRYLDFVLKLGS